MLRHLGHGGGNEVNFKFLVSLPGTWPTMSTGGWDTAAVVCQGCRDRVLQTRHTFIGIKFWVGIAPIPPCHFKACYFSNKDHNLP